MNFNFSLLKEIIIGVSALVGMSLGVYNLIHSINKEKVRLKIIPKSVMGETRVTETGAKGLILAANDFSNKNHLFAFEIINKSNFSVIVDEIGFKIKGKKSRMIIPAPFLGDNGEAYWSPDGKQIIFQSKRDGHGCDKIYIMNADGTSIKKLVSPGWQPAWFNTPNK